MIVKTYGRYQLICDGCYEQADFDEFEEALIYKRKEGWSSIPINGSWEDYCPDCSREIKEN